MTARLLQSPVFHRAVGHVAKKVRQVRHGKLPEEMGGTNIDSMLSQDKNEGERRADFALEPGPSFMGHFMDEVKTQLKGEQAKQMQQKQNSGQASKFREQFIGALKEQTRSQPPKR
ncbi:hypothetical protein LTR28_006604 [Elasticomyces elasticus]|nr:hypothetical protein LTR28_006604 [Elasticomyces elasticus]